jgi:hypothetical protein
MTYKFKYRRKNSWFWKTYVVTGHMLEITYDKQINPKTNEVDVAVQKPSGTMVIYFSDGSLRTIPDWNECELILGIDWKLATKKDMEKEVGQPIQLNN